MNPSDRHCHAIAGMKSIVARSLSSDRLIIDERAAVGFGATLTVHYSTLLVQTLTTGELGWDFQDQHRARQQALGGLWISVEAWSERSGFGANVCGRVAGN